MTKWKRKTPQMSNNYNEIRGNKDSHITHKTRVDGPEEVQIIRNQEKGLIARHDPQVPWEHMIGAVIPAVQRELTSDFAEVCQTQERKSSIAFEPFNLTVSLWRKGEEGRLYIKRNEKCLPLHEKPFEETAETLINKLPKIMWSIKKAYTAQKCDLLMIALEWMETKDAAPASKVAEMVAKLIRESGN